MDHVYVPAVPFNARNPLRMMLEGSILLTQFFLAESLAIRVILREMEKSVARKREPKGKE